MKVGERRYQNTAEGIPTFVNGGQYRFTAEVTVALNLEANLGDCAERANILRPSK